MAIHLIAPVLQAAVEGRMPRHLLCGLDHLLSQGCHVHAVDRTKSMPSRSLRALTPTEIGEWFDPSQYVRAVARAVAREATLYSMIELPLGNLPLIRAIGRRRPRVVTLVHGKAVTDRLARRLDGALCLTDRAAESLVTFGLHAVARVNWGPDLEFRGYQCTSPHEFCVASLGRTGRDLSTLVSALAKAGVDAVVDVPHSRSLPSRVRRLDDVAGGCAGFDPGSYARPLEGFQSASVFVVPLIRPFDVPIGLTEVNDALALGRPIIMTRTRGLGFDIEAEGVGMWVEPGDSTGLAAAIIRMRDDSAMRTELGANGRRFAENRWNYNLFSKELDNFLTLHSF